MGNTNVGTVGNWDLTDRECRVRHGQNKTETVGGVFVRVLCNECKRITCNEGGACTGLISTWNSPFSNSCGTDADNVTLSCHGGFGEPIEKLCNEAMEATICESGECTYDDAKCLFDGNKNETYYYGTCQKDDFVISDGWIGVFIAVPVVLFIIWAWNRCKNRKKQEKKNYMKFDSDRRKRFRRARGYRQPRTDFKMARSDSV